MSEDNIFTLFLKGIFILILIILALALIVPFLSGLISVTISSETIGVLGSFILFFVLSIILLALFSGVSK